MESTPNELARAAIDLGNLYLRIAPAESNRYAQSLKLAQFHLRSAAEQLRRVAEDMAKESPTA
jgi:hypothetical protein